MANKLPASRDTPFRTDFGCKCYYEGPDCFSSGAEFTWKTLGPYPHEVVRATRKSVGYVLFSPCNAKLARKVGRLILLAASVKSQLCCGVKPEDIDFAAPELGAKS